MGLAVGVALVVAVTAYAAGVGKAQDQVLQSLYGVGTDITVSQQQKMDQSGRSGSACSRRTSPNRGRSSAARA